MHYNEFPNARYPAPDHLADGRPDYLDEGLKSILNSAKTDEERLAYLEMAMMKIFGPKPAEYINQVVKSKKGTVVLRSPTQAEDTMAARGYLIALQQQDHRGSDSDASH